MSRLSNESKLLMGRISDLKPFTGSGRIPAHPWMRAFHIRGKGENLVLGFFFNKNVGCLKLPLCLECQNKSWGRWISGPSTV